MKFGLEQHIIDKLIAVFEQHPKVDKALVFGSRAKGNYRPDSDIDIAIKGQDLNTDAIIAMSVAFEEKGISHKIDLINYQIINEPDLKDHIDRVGIELYNRWKEYRLEKISKVQTGPFGSQLHMSDYKVAGTPIITVEHLGENRLLHYNLPLVSDEDKERLIKYTLKEGDIVFSRVGSVDRRAYVSKEEDGWMFSGRCLRVRVDKEKVNPKFLSFYFGQESFKETIRRIAVGATMPSINTTILNEVEVTIPPIQDQIAIATILSSLDDKIDLLHRQNKTLEQLAETLFRQWFVEEAEESWEAVRLEKLGKIICGKTPSKKVSSYFNGEYPFIKIPDMHGNTYVFESIDSLTEQGLNSQQNKTIPPKSICVSCIATVGLVVMNGKTSQTNQQINSIIPAKDIYRYFIYLKMLSMKDDLLAMASGGTATDNLNTGDFSKIEIQLPTNKILNDFHEEVSPLFEKIYTNQTQIRTLTQTRDTLLPKLMSGEVRVKM